MFQNKKTFAKRFNTEDQVKITIKQAVALGITKIKAFHPTHKEWIFSDDIGIPSHLNKEFKIYHSNTFFKIKPNDLVIIQKTYL